MREFHHSGINRQAYLKNWADILWKMATSRKIRKLVALAERDEYGGQISDV